MRSVDLLVLLCLLLLTPLPFPRLPSVDAWPTSCPVFRGPTWGRDPPSTAPHAPVDDAIACTRSFREAYDYAHMDYRHFEAESEPSGEHTSTTPTAAAALPLRSARSQWERREQQQHAQQSSVAAVEADAAVPLVYGSWPYHSNSSVCLAAIHSGVITDEDGGWLMMGPFAAFHHPLLLDLSGPHPDEPVPELGPYLDVLSPISGLQLFPLHSSQPSLSNGVQSRHAAEGWTAGSAELPTTTIADVSFVVHSRGNLIESVSHPPFSARSGHMQQTLPGLFGGGQRWPVSVLHLVVGGRNATHYHNDVWVAAQVDGHGPPHYHRTLHDCSGCGCPTRRSAAGRTWRVNRFPASPHSFAQHGRTAPARCRRSPMTRFQCGGICGCTGDRPATTAGCRSWACAVTRCGCSPSPSTRRRRPSLCRSRGPRSRCDGPSSVRRATGKVLGSDPGLPHPPLSPQRRACGGSAQLRGRDVLAAFRNHQRDVVQLRQPIRVSLGPLPAVRPSAVRSVGQPAAQTWDFARGPPYPGSFGGGVRYLEHWVNASWGLARLVVAELLMDWWTCVAVGDGSDFITALDACAWLHLADVSANVSTPPSPTSSWPVPAVDGGWWSDVSADSSHLGGGRGSREAQQLWSVAQPYAASSGGDRPSQQRGGQYNATMITRP